MNVSNQQMKTICKCGKELFLTRVGGQYQDSYSSSCICGRKWMLEDLSEDLIEDK